jgi:hypothetical protein
VDYYLIYFLVIFILLSFFLGSVFIMAPTVCWVYDLCKDGLVKLCERFRIDWTGSLSELRSCFMAFLRNEQEQGLLTIHAEVTGRGAPFEVSSVDIQTGDHSRVIQEDP